MRRIEVVGRFDDALAERVVREIRAAVGRPVDLRIDSEGGKFGSLLDILLEIEESSAPITTTIVGQACSAAGVLAIAGDVRRIDRSATIMLHYARPGSRQSALEMRELVREYTGQGMDDIIAWLAHERTFVAAEAVQCGLADRIVAADAPEPVRLREPRKRPPTKWLRDWREFAERLDLRVPT